MFGRSLQASTTMAALSLRRSGRADLALRLAGRAEPSVFAEMCAVVAPPAPADAVPAVFTHGDCWANNLLFKYGSGGAPVEARLVDLAGIRYSSPALDILHFLNTSVLRDVRVEHLDALLLQYLRALGATVREATRAARADTAGVCPLGCPSGQMSFFALKCNDRGQRSHPVHSGRPGRYSRTTLS